MKNNVKSMKTKNKPRKFTWDVRALRRQTGTPRLPTGCNCK
jgi:hypothetical protein